MTRITLAAFAAIALGGCRYQGEQAVDPFWGRQRVAPPATGTVGTAVVYPGSPPVGTVPQPAMPGATSGAWVTPSTTSPNLLPAPMTSPGAAATPARPTIPAVPAPAGSAPFGTGASATPPPATPPPASPPLSAPSSGYSNGGQSSPPAHFPGGEGTRSLPATPSPSPAGSGSPSPAGSGSPPPGGAVSSDRYGPLPDRYGPSPVTSPPPSNSPTPAPGAGSSPAGSSGSLSSGSSATTPAPSDASNGAAPSVPSAPLGASPSGSQDYLPKDGMKYGGGQ
jgi:hypothetical protein